MRTLTDAELLHVLDELPALLEHRPELESRIYRAFMKMFATKEDEAAVPSELRGSRAETRENFEQGDHTEKVQQ